MGLFISFEGCEGCGKSTQAKRLAVELQRLGYAVTRTYEPGGTPLGQQLRRYLKKVHEAAISPEAEMLLFAAARSQLTRDILVPALEQNQIVICDRYSDSTVAYQGFGRGLSLDTIAEVNRIATRGLRPDLVFLLDMDPSRALQRKKATRDRFEHEVLEFHLRVREGYLRIAHEDPSRWVVLDASRSFSSTAHQIQQVVATILERAGSLKRLPG